MSYQRRHARKSRTGFPSSILTRCSTPLSRNAHLALGNGFSERRSSRLGSVEKARFYGVLEMVSATLCIHVVTLANCKLSSSSWRWKNDTHV